MNVCGNCLIMYYEQRKILKLGISSLSTKHEGQKCMHAYVCKHKRWCLKYTRHTGPDFTMYLYT